MTPFLQAALFSFVAAITYLDPTPLLVGCTAFTFCMFLLSLRTMTR